MTRPLTPRRRLRFRWELLHTRGLEAVWPDGSRGEVESVVVGPYDFWTEALLVRRDGRTIRVPATDATAIHPRRRVLLGPPASRRLRRRRHRPQAAAARLLAPGVGA